MALSEANNYLAVNLHRLLAEESSNVIFSPFSISTALAILLCAAEGETGSQLRAAFGHVLADVKNADIANAFEEQLLALQKDTNSCALFCANSMLTQEGIGVKNQYKSILSDTFKALLLEANVSKGSENVVSEINEWVKEKTKNMISSIVESLDPEAVMVLINAVYFKGSWLHKFDEASTSTEVFYNKGTESVEKEVEMMNMTDNFLFTENESFQALQLPYIDKQVAMLVLLPCSKDGLELLEASLTPSFVRDLRKSMFQRKVEVSLPKFRLEYSKSLMQCFQSLGIEKVFKQGAELGLASDSDLHVSEIFHKAVLDVNEEGSEASSVTVISVMQYCHSVDPVFYADHPFAFIIYDIRSDLILFMGRIEEF